jgi:CBS domain-containing protein
MTVSEVARSQVVTASPEETVADAVARMQEHAVGSVVLVDDADRPTGIVTDRVIALAVTSDTTDEGDGSLASRPLADLPVESVEPVDADSGIYDLLEHMADSGARRVPVVEDGALVGIVSLSDLVVLLGMELQHVANVIRTSSPAYERAPTDVYE